MFGATFKFQYMSVFIGHSEYLFKIFDGWLAFVLTLTDCSLLLYCRPDAHFLCCGCGLYLLE